MRLLNKITKTLCLLALFSVWVPEAASAKDFRTLGSTFEIKEEGFLSMVYRKLKSLDIGKEKSKMQEIARKKIEEPEVLVHITNSLEPREFTFDPTYTLEEDIKLPDGKILYSAGTKVNPLDHMEFDRVLVFLDAKDENQVRWLDRFLHNGPCSNKEVRIILTSGSPLKFGEILQRNVYFDQFGELTNKFRILHVPAVVSQNSGEKYLRIKEVKISG